MFAKCTNESYVATAIFLLGYKGNILDSFFSGEGGVLTVISFSGSDTEGNRGEQRGRDFFNLLAHPQWPPLS